MAFEVELKFKLKDEGGIRRLLKEINFEFNNVENTTDYYFNSNTEDFKISDKVLRLRVTVIDKVTRKELTYKGKKLHRETKTREEITVVLEDENSMQEILERMGYTKVGEVIKRRENWTFEDYNASIDTIIGLGTFFEIDAIVEEQKLIPAKIKVLKEICVKLMIDVSEEIREGYLQLLENQVLK